LRSFLHNDGFRLYRSLDHGSGRGRRGFADDGSSDLDGRDNRSDSRDDGGLSVIPIEVKIANAGRRRGSYTGPASLLRALCRRTRSRLNRHCNHRRRRLDRKV